MNRGLETPGTAPIRTLVVGSSAWTRTASATLADGTGSVTVDDRATTLEAGRLESADCVLTDDRGVVSAASADRPVVYAADELDDASIADLVDAGATEVIDRSTIENAALLEHRLRRAVRCSSAQSAVERRDEWYRTLLEHGSDVLFVLEESGRVRFVDPSIERLSGVSAGDVRGEDVLEAIYPDDRDDVADAFEAVRSADLGATRTVEFRYRDRNDDATWAVYEAVLTNRLDDPVVGGVIASVRDVTRYHRVEQELGESFERVTDAFYALDTEWRFTYVNRRAEELLGYSRDELIGNDVREIFDHGARSELYDRFREAMDRQESLSWARYSQSLDIWMEINVYPSETGLSVYFHDISDRVERERELSERTERLQVLVENAPVIHYVIDGDGTFTLSEGRGLENIGLESDEVVGESLFDAFEEYPEIRADARRALEGEPVHCERRIRDRVFETWYQPVTSAGDVDRVIGVAVDVTERVQYQEALNALHEATSHLLTVESKQAACEYIVDVANDVLDLESIVYRFDSQRNELLPAAYSTSVESTVGQPPRLEPNDSITWETFVTGTASVFDDVRTSDHVYDETTDVRSGFYVPLGDHGVLVAVSSEPGRYDDETVELAKLFATTAEAALDRIGRARRLHDREQELQRQNRHLERLNNANQVRQDIEEHLLMADSRTEVEQGICDRLVELDGCSLAWIGEPDPSGNQLRPRSRAGLDRGYLEAVTVTTVDDSAAEPAGRAGRTRTSTSVENVADAIRDGAWRAEALSRNFQSVYAVPLVYDGFLYGVLSVYGDERDAFDETLRSTLDELGETIAHTIDAVNRKHALLDDDVSEIELELEGGSSLCRLSERLGARVAFEGATPQVDGAPIVFAAVDAPVDADALADAVDGIGAVSVIAEADDETLLQLQVVEPFLGSIVTGHGATLREFVADDSGGRAVVDVPAAVEIRELLSDLDRHGLSASMVAKRDQSASDASTLDAPAHNALLEKFTDRQREVIQTAYHGGFFEWPRRTTGEELADSLEISAPAFHKHVRSAEQKLFAALFDGATMVPEG